MRTPPDGLAIITEYELTASGKSQQLTENGESAHEGIGPFPVFLFLAVVDPQISQILPAVIPGERSESRDLLLLVRS